MSKIISFHGADHKVGLSQLAGSLFESLGKKYPEKEILLVNADGEYGFDNYYSLISSDIESLVITEIKDPEYIKRKIVFRDKLYVLNLSKILNQSSVLPDLIEILLSKLSDLFDLIIIDTGASLFNGITLGALFSSDFIYYVLNQKESSFRRCESLALLYEQLKIDFDKTILNLYSKNNLFDKAYISERLNIVPANLNIVSEDKKLPGNKPSKRYVKEIDKIAKEVAIYAGL